MLMGEALGATEAFKGVPFVGEAGWQLNRILARTPFDREDFVIYNAIACQPPKNWLVGAPWESGALEHCRRHWVDVVLRYKPKVIVALGGTALKVLYNAVPVEKNRGYVFAQVSTYCPGHVVATYHPSYILQGNQNLVGVSAFDITKAVNIAKNGWTYSNRGGYLQNPTNDQIDQFTADALFWCSDGKWMTADIETSRSSQTPEDEYSKLEDFEITRISFAFRPGYAITIPWHQDTLERIQGLLDLPHKLVFWNADFDVPRLKAKGMRIKAEIVDAMYMWHFLQSDLPKSLGFVATFYTNMPEWKSTSDHYPEYYSCCDADAQIQCANGIRADLEKEGRFDQFMRHHTQLQPILQEMGQAGVLLNQDKRTEFRAAMKADLDGVNNEIQQAIPRDLRPFKPRRKVPRDAVLGAAVKTGQDEFVWDCDSDTGEWGIRSVFLYSSPRQVLGYIKAQGHPVPRNYKTGKDTTGKDDIEALARKYPKDPLYPRIIQARELQKVIGQYIDGYEPDKDGKIRTTFTQKPSTWRLASEQPNVQNIRKRWHLANKYREQFVPAPGNVLVELDYRAIEAVLVGYYARDEDYIKAAKLGVHAILASHILDHMLKDWWPVWSYEDVRKVVKEIKKDKRTYDQSKTIVHLSNYLGSARRIKIDNPDLFATVAEAEKLQKIYFATIAKKVQKWQVDTLQKAAGQSWLQNVFGYRHHFFDVLRWDGTSGSDAKKAMAFLPQSTAAGVIKEAILRIAEHPALRKGLRWQIHDSLLFELPNDDTLPTLIGEIKQAMEYPVPELDGLSIEVEVSWSDKSWGEMVEWQGS